MMKKMYTQPDAEIMLLSSADILLFSGDTEFTDDGWLTQGFTVKNASGVNSSRFGAK